MALLENLATNIGASIIYDFSKAVINKAAKTEMVQLTLKKLGVTQNSNDFITLYVEALVEMRYIDKDATVLAFFREESIMQVFYNYYYGDSTQRNNEQQLTQGIAHCVEALSVGDDVKANNVNVPDEVEYFWQIFKQKVNDNRTVGEVETKQILDEIRQNTNDIQLMQQNFKTWMEQNGKSNFQFAGKIFNIKDIGKANFGTEINNSKNVVNGELNARDVRIGDNYYNYGVNNEIKIDRFLTPSQANTNFFIGRDAALIALENAFEKHNLVLLSGEGGLGKTSLADKLWLKQIQKTHFTHFAWLNAQNGIANALLNMADALQLKFEPTDTTEQQLARVMHALVNLKPTCFFVLDNADNIDDFKKFYTTLCKLHSCKILITTRVKSMSNAHVYHIKPLDATDATKLFTHYFKKHTEADDALLQQLLEAVEYNTLVIELLAKNLTVINKLRTTYSLQNLFDDLKTKGLFALKTKNVEHTYHETELREKNLDDIIKGMYDLADLNDTEKFILSNFAVLPSEYISLDIFTDLLKPKNSDAFDDALLSLTEKGWLNYRELENDFKISPVVQNIVQFKNKTVLWADCKTLLYTLNKKLHPDQLHEKENYKLTPLWTKYIESILTHFTEPHSTTAVLCERIGTYFSTRGNLDRAIFYFEKRRDISTQLCALEPENSWNKNSLAISYSKLGETHAQLGNLDKALKYYEDDLEITKQLFEDFPNNVGFKNGLAISYEKLGKTHAQLGNLDKALIFYEDYNKLEKQLFEDFPNNVEYKNGLAISYQKLGIIYAALGNLDKALNYYEDYNGLNKQLFKDFPNNVEYKNGLAISYSKLGETHATLGNLDKALKYYEDDLELTKQLFEEFPNNVGFKNGLAISYSKLGNTHAQLGNLDKALKFYEDFNNLEKQLFEVFPNNVGFKNGLAVSFSQLGRLYEDHKNDTTKARAFYEQCQTLWSELANSFPAYVEFKTNLTWVQNRLAALTSKT